MLRPYGKFILDKTEGNPFFMEEIVQELREQGILTDPRRVGNAHQYVDLRLPTTVQGILAARMDRLPPDEKGLLQTLAVIGREFSASLLRKSSRNQKQNSRPACPSPGSRVHLRTACFPDVEYIFKHALTQEVAYNSLLHERRKIIHERAAQAIEEIYRHKLDDHYSELAHHYSRSGNTQKAVDYLQLAGQQAVQRSANDRSDQSPHRCLRIPQDIARHAERAQQELALRVTLGAPLQATRSFASPEVKATYTRARELCQQVGETRQFFSVLWGCDIHLCGASFSRHASSGSNSWAWLRRSKTRPCSWRPIGQWAALIQSR